MTAILKYHKFERKIEIPYFMHRIDIDIMDKLNISNFIDCTPDNIIKHGKYSVIKPLKKTTLTFEYFGRDKDILIYKLRNEYAN